MAISLRLTDEEDATIRAYAKIHNVNVSTLIRDVIFEKIQEEYDLKNFDKNFEEAKNNGVWYSLDEVERELGL